jgi:hypothetical protein
MIDSDEEFRSNSADRSNELVDLGGVFVIASKQNHATRRRGAKSIDLCLMERIPLDIDHDRTKRLCDRTHA